MCEKEEKHIWYGTENSKRFVHCTYWITEHIPQQQCFELVADRFMMLFQFSMQFKVQCITIVSYFVGSDLIRLLFCVLFHSFFFLLYSSLLTARGYYFFFCFFFFIIRERYTYRCTLNKTKKGIHIRKECSFDNLTIHWVWTVGYKAR